MLSLGFRGDVPVENEFFEMWFHMVSYASSTNRSLSRRKAFVPFRDSKLTRVLQAWLLSQGNDGHAKP